MEVHYPTLSEPATPEYVLAVLQDLIRQTEDWPDLEVTFETTVADTFPRDVDYPFENRPDLGKILNPWLGIAIPDEDWAQVLEPPEERTVGEVCELVARHLARPRIRPARVAGVCCLPAGAFLTIRSLLHQAGAKAADIGPSTPLFPYTNRFLEVFVGPISRLAPGSLPQWHKEFSAATKKAWFDFGLGLLCLGVNRLVCLPGLEVTGYLFVFGSFIKMWLAAKWLGPSKIKFGELRTFRDLAVLIADRANA